MAGSFGRKRIGNDFRVSKWPPGRAARREFRVPVDDHGIDEGRVVGGIGNSIIEAAITTTTTTTATTTTTTTQQR